MKEDPQLLSDNNPKISQEIPVPMHTGGPFVHHISLPSRADDSKTSSSTRARSPNPQYHQHLSSSPYVSLIDPPSSSLNRILSHQASTEQPSINPFPQSADHISNESRSDSHFDFMEFFRNSRLPSLNSSRFPSLSTFTSSNDQQKRVEETQPMTSQNQLDNERIKGGNTNSVSGLTWNLFGNDEMISSQQQHRTFEPPEPDEQQPNSFPRHSSQGSSLISRELAEQLRKGVSFTANVAGGALRMPELKGVPKAPKVPKAALDLSTAALKVLEDERVGRREEYRDVRDNVLYDGERHRDYGLSDSVKEMSLDLQREDGTLSVERKSHLGESVETISIQTPPTYLEPIGYAEPLKQLEVLSRDDLERGSPVEEPPKGDQSIASTVASLLQPISEKSPLPLSSREPRQSSTLDHLVLMTFNAGLLEYRLGGVTWYSNPPFTKRRLYHIAPALRNAKCDVIALQEVYEEWQADFLTESLRISYPFTARRTSGGAFSLHNGLMILSRFPVLHTLFHPFHSVTPIEKMFASKGMLEATIEIPTIGRVMFLNIHLASGAVDPESEALEQLRNDEIRQALAVCSDAAIRGEIPVIIGDLNAAPNLCSSNYRVFLERGWRDSFLLAVKGEEARDPYRELTRLDSWNTISGRRVNHRDRNHDRNSVSVKVAQSMSKVKKVLGLSEDTLKRLFFGNGEPAGLRKRVHEFSTDRGKSQSIFCSERHSRRKRAGHRLGSRKMKTPMVEIADSKYNRNQDLLSANVNRSNNGNVFEATDSCVDVSDHSSNLTHRRAILSRSTTEENEGPSETSDYACRRPKQKSYSRFITTEAHCAQPPKADNAQSTSQKETTMSDTVESTSPETLSEAEEEKSQLLVFKDEPRTSMSRFQRAFDRKIQVSNPNPKTSETFHSDVSQHPRFNPIIRQHRRALTDRTMSRSSSSPSRRQILRSGKSKLKKKKIDPSTLVSTVSDVMKPLAYYECRTSSMLSTGDAFLSNNTSTQCDDFVVVDINLDHDPFCTDIHTWDPLNPLNVIGPHSECHGLRCDHVFLPPEAIAGGLGVFEAVDASVVFTEPSVTVEGCCCGLMGQGSLVTLSDHYAVRIELQRSLCRVSPP